MLGQALGVITGAAKTLVLADWLVIVGAWCLVLASRRLGMWLYALIALPGTLAHEGMHYLVALVLGARPHFPTLLPQRQAGGWRLGAVAFHAGPARALPIALAPLALLPLAAGWALWLLVPAPWPLRALHGWIVGALLAAAWPSRTDWRLAAPGLGVGAVLLLVLAAGWFVFMRE